MKKTYFLSLLFLLVLASCDKSENFYEKLGQGAYLTFVRQTNGLLNGIDANSSVGEVVNSYGEPVENINLYVSATASLDKTKWKLIKNIPFSGETTITTTNKEIATALGLSPGALPAGTVYHLYNEAVLKDGRKFSSANTSDIDLENQPAFNVAFHFTATVVCPYNASTIAGTYTVVRDDWQDWNPGETVEVTAGPGANQVNLSEVWPNPAFGNVVSPLTLTVNPATGVVTVPANVAFANYGGQIVSTDAGSTGFIFSCKNQINVRILLKGFGANQLILQK